MAFLPLRFQESKQKKATQKSEKNSMSIKRLGAYCNPFDNEFHSVQDFKKLSKGHKALAALAFLCGAPFLGVGAVAAFRHYVSKHTPRSVQVDEVALKAIFRPRAPSIPIDELAYLTSPDTFQKKYCALLPNFTDKNTLSTEEFYDSALDLPEKPEFQNINAKRAEIRELLKKPDYKESQEFMLKQHEYMTLVTPFFKNNDILS